MMRRPGSNSSILRRVSETNKRDVLPVKASPVPDRSHTRQRSRSFDPSPDRIMAVMTNGGGGGSPHTPKIRRRRSYSRLDASSDHSVNSDLEMDGDSHDRGAYVVSSVPPTPIRRRSNRSGRASIYAAAAISNVTHTPLSASSQRRHLHRQPQRRRSAAALVETLENESSTLGDITNYIFENSDDNDDLNSKDSDYETDDMCQESKLPLYSSDERFPDPHRHSNKKKRRPRGMNGSWTLQNNIFTTSVNKLRHRKTEHVLILFLFMATTFFAATAYHQVFVATDLLEDVQLGENKLLVHVHKVEQQALQFAHHLKDLNKKTDGHRSNVQDNSNEKEVDSGLIQAQIDQLQDMEAQLNHEVQSLRQHIQQSAKLSLTREYGEGAVQVFLEIRPTTPQNEGGLAGEEPPPKNKAIAIRLWYDTPHSAWTFVQQVNSGIWNKASFSIEKGRGLVAEPAKGGLLQPALDFVEASERAHKRYTVTLTNNNMWINLQDNKNLHGDEEACVGVIHEGFDVLHTLISDTQTHGPGTLRIHKATATYLK